MNATAIYIAAKITGLFPFPPAVLFTAKGGGARASCARAGEVVVAVTYRIWSHPPLDSRARGIPKCDRMVQ